MDQNHASFQDDLAAYALGALDPEAAASLEAHLQTCESCRTELAEFRSVSSGLLAALPARAPSASVRRNLQKQLTGQARRAQPRFGFTFGQALVAGLMVALVGLNALLVSQVYAVRQEQAELLNDRKAEQSAIAMLAYPSTQTLAFNENGVSGSLLVDKQRNLLAVFAWHLSTPPAGKTYQMWLVGPNGDRTSGGFLVPESGYPFVMAVIRSPQPLANYKSIGVTVEPLGGSPGPTGPKVIGVDF